MRITTTLCCAVILLCAPCRSSLPSDLVGSWSVSRDFESDMETGGLNGNDSTSLKISKLRDGTIRVLHTYESITDGLLGFFSSDVRTTLDLRPNGSAKGSTAVNKLRTESIKGTWKLKNGRITATLYSSSRTGKRVTSTVTIRRISSKRLLAEEERSDGFSTSSVATRSRE